MARQQVLPNGPVDLTALLSRDAALEAVATTPAGPVDLTALLGSGREAAVAAVGSRGIAVGEQRPPSGPP